MAVPDLIGSEEARGRAGRVHRMERHAGGPVEPPGEPGVAGGEDVHLVPRVGQRPCHEDRVRADAAGLERRELPGAEADAKWSHAFGP